MTKYVYKTKEYLREESLSDDEYLEHFDVPKLKFPKVNTSRVKKAVDSIGDNFNKAKKSLGKMAKNAGKGMDKAADKIEDTAKDLKKKATKTAKKLGKKVDREWKNHKWIARKRDKNGKWIYDYGHGFPGEKKNDKEGASTPLKLAQELISQEELKKNMPSGWASNDDLRIDRDKHGKKGNSKVARFLDAMNNAKDLMNPFKAMSAKTNLDADLKAISKRKAAEESKQKSKKDPKTGLPLKDKKTLRSDDLAAVNPNHNISGGSGNSNCYACALTYDMRRRGYNVTAPGDKNGGSAHTVISCYKNGDPKYIEPDLKPGEDTTYIVGKNKKLTQAAEKYMSEEPDNTRGIAWVRWDNGTGVQGNGGHCVAYEKQNGQVLIYDGQTGERLHLGEYVDKASAFMYMRTDNLEVNYDNIKDFVEG